MANAHASAKSNEKSARKRRRAETRARVTAAAPVPVPTRLRASLPPDGRPLDPRTRAEMESRFGEDFSRVLIHTGARAEGLADAHDANAYTLGESIVFDQARFAPDTASGKRLLAHELAHVVQQRRGGGRPTEPGDDAALESHADHAAQAVAAGANVHVGGSATVGVMCDRSGRKKTRRGDREDDDDFDDDDDSAQDRGRDRQRTQTRKQQRAAAGKDPDQIIAEDAEREMRAMEADYDRPEAQRRSPRRKRKDLNKFEQHLDETPGIEIDKSKRKGAFDERQRTPNSTAGAAQTKHVAGGPQLPGMELEAGRAHYAQPDYSMYVRDRSGQLRRVHVNLKSDRIDRLTPSQARSRAREYYFQARSNSRHLADGERIVISFARVPPPEVQEAIKAELFRENGPISQVRFGSSVHHDEDYKGPRKPADASPADERKRKERESKARAKQQKAEKRAAKKQREKERAAKRKEQAAQKKAEQRERQRQREAARKQRDQAKAAAKAQKQREREQAMQARADAREAAKAEKQRQRQAGKTKGTGPKRATSKRPAKSETTLVAARPRVRVAVSPDHQAAHDAGGDAGHGAPHARVGTQPKLRVPTLEDLQAEHEADEALKAEAAEKTAKRRRYVPSPGAKPAPAPRRDDDADAHDAGGETKSRAPARRAAPRKPAAITPPAPAHGAPQPAAPAARQMPARKPAAPTKAAPPMPAQVAPGKADAPKPKPAAPRGRTKAPTKVTPPRSNQGAPPAPHGSSKPGMSTQGKGKGKGKSGPPRPKINAVHAPAASSQKQSFYSDQVQITVTEVLGAVDKPYHVTTRLTVHAGGGLSGSVGEDRGASGHVSASGSVSIAYTQPMTESEKNAYLAAVAGGRGGSQPQMSIIELIARGQTGAAAKLIENARGSGNAKQDFNQRAEGSEQEVSVEGDVGGGIGGHQSVGKGNFGATAQLSRGKGVRQTSTRRGDHEVLTVTVTQRKGQALGLSGGYGVASGGYTDSRDETEVRGISFTLDPNATEYDYATVRAEILAADTLQALEAIAARHDGLATGRSKHDEKGQVGTTSVGVLGFGVDLDMGGFYGEGENVEGDSKVRTVTGGASLGGSLTAGGKRINPESRTDSFSGWADENNVGGGETRSDNRQVDWVKTAANLFDSAADTPAATTVALAKQNKPVLQEKVDSAGKILVDDSYTRIAETAKDPKAWLNAWNFRGVSRGAAEEWEGIRQLVLAANGDRYKIEQAMSKWQKGDSGRSGDVQRLVGDTGIAFEFPDAIADQKPIYDALVAADPTVTAQQLAADGNIDQALKELNSLHDRLWRLLQTIQMHESEFDEPAKFAEMQRRINQRRQAIRERIRKLEPAKPAAPGQPAAAVKVEPPPKDFVGPPSPDQQAAIDAAALADRREASERIRELVGECLSNREKENQVFAAVEAEFNSWFPSVINVIEKLNTLKPMYAKWDEAIAQLRLQYPKINDPASRANQFAPNHARWNELNARKAR